MRVYVSHCTRSRRKLFSSGTRTHDWTPHADFRGTPRDWDGQPRGGGGNGGSTVIFDSLYTCAARCLHKTLHVVHNQIPYCLISLIVCAKRCSTPFQKALIIINRQSDLGLDDFHMQLFGASVISYFACYRRIRRRRSWSVW